VPKARDLEGRLQQTERQLRLFQKISRFMVREMSLTEVLQGIVALVVEFTQCDSCLMYLLDGEDLVLCASNTPHPSTIGKLKMKWNEGLTGWVARERRLLAISREAYKDARFKKFGELEEDTYEAFLSAPVTARNRVVGVINVQHVCRTSIPAAKWRCSPRSANRWDASWCSPAWPPRRWNRPITWNWCFPPDCRNETIEAS